MDKARDILSQAERFANLSPADLEEIPPGQRALLAVQFAKLAHELGVMPEAEKAGRPPSWYVRLHQRHGRYCFHLGYKLGLRTAQELEASSPHNIDQTSSD